MTTKTVDDSDQRVLRTTARDFFEKYSDESAVRSAMETDEGFDQALWSRMADELGLQGLLVPDRFGGNELGFVQLQIVMEEMGRALVCAPFLSSAVLAVSALLASGDDERCAELLPNIADWIRLFNALEMLVIVVTNQRGIGRGIMTEEQLHAIHSELQDHLGKTHDVAFDDIYYCPDLDSNSPRRKPAPGMLLEAAKKWDIDLASSWMSGDSLSDVAAGKAAGTHTAFLVTRHSTDLPANTVILDRLEGLLEYL